VAGLLTPRSVECPFDPAEKLRAASKLSCRHLSCVDAAKDELRRGVNMVVLCGASNRQVTLTWPEGRC
jgi:hypothetical protein